MTNETTRERYPLANDANGNPLQVPENAAGWRVRKLARKAGRPKVIFDAETGRPLELPLTITYDEFADVVAEAGRYRLEAFDGDGRNIPGCVAVTEVVFDDGDENTVAAVANPVDALPHLIQLVGKLVETNARVMEAMASAFGHVKPAAAPPQTVVVERPAESKSEDNPFVTNMVQAFLQQFMAQKLGGAASAATAPNGAQQ
jgi:hypothetical protein